MVFNLSTPQGVSLARRRFEQLVAKESPCVSIIERKKRTLPQNALLHSWIRILQNELGYSSYEECKRDVVRETFGQYIHYNQIKKRNEYTDYETHKLQKKDMTILLEQIKAWAMENHILLPSAGEKGYYEMLEEYDQNEEDEGLD